MISQRAKSWRWYDWIFVILVAIIVIAAIQIIAPSSGLALSLHTGFHALALGVGWVANGLGALSQLLDKL